MGLRLTPAPPGASFAYHPASGRYRYDGDLRGQVWWSIGWRRVEIDDLELAGRIPVPPGEALKPR